MTTIRLKTGNKDTYNIAMRIAHEGIVKVPPHIHVGVVIKLVNEINKTTKNVDYKIEKDGIIIKKVNSFILTPWIRRKN